MFIFTCTHSWCYALTCSNAIAHILDATLLRYYAMGPSLELEHMHTCCYARYCMLRYESFSCTFRDIWWYGVRPSLALAHILDATLLHYETSCCEHTENMSCFDQTVLDVLCPFDGCEFTPSPTVVVLGIRLIRRPWKGSLFWDVPFTIPWKGSKFETWSLGKWGFRIWISALFNMLHMLSYVYQGGGGVGGDNVLDEFYTWPTELVMPLWTCCACSRRVIRRGGGGCDNVPDEYYTWPTEPLAVVSILRMLSYGHQEGWGGDTVLDENFTWPTELVAAVNMLHMLSYGHGGAVGWVIAFLTSIIHGPGNLLPLWTCCTCSLMVIRRGCDNVLGEHFTWPTELVAVVYKKGTFGLTAAHGVVMSPWFALLESVAVALPKALWHWGFEKRKDMDGWMFAWGTWFFSSLEEQN